MPSVCLSRYAIQELRQLRSATNNRIIPEILQELADGSESGLHILVNYHSIRYRKRRLEGGGYLRLFMDDHSPSHYTIISAVLRDDDTYEQNFDALPREPCYLWDGEIGLNWDWFINEGYLYSAQINDQQRQDADDAVNGDRQPYHHRHPDALRVPYESTIHQSAPGTGKTLTAAEKACELAEAGQNVVFLLPESLIDQQVSKYRCVRQIRQQPAGQNLFIGTFHQWLAHQFPTLPYQVASPETELQHLQKLAYERRNWYQSDRAPITYRDVLLYQLYILSGDDDDHRKDDIYDDNESRIEELKNIPTRWWQEDWPNSDLCRRDYALVVKDYLKEQPPNPPNPGLTTTIIADEAQDYLIEEIELIKHLCKHWQTESQHQVNLWLLGDINQRIAPVNFEWGGLHLNKLQELEWKNYRTTETILTLANRFQVKANQTRTRNKKWLPKTTNPEFCFERPGDAVRLLVYPDLASAETFLDPLMETISDQISGWQEKHSLQWRLAARARLFCSDNYHVSPDRVKFLEFMPVSQAKGREFESCIAFCLFDLPPNYGQMEAYTKWYTQLTRARRRLLIITTQAQLNAIGQDIFQLPPDSHESIDRVQWLDYRNPQQVKDALDWIIEFRSGLDGSETGRQGLTDIVIDGILQASPILYYDVYDVLSRYDITGQNLIDLEIEVVSHLFAKSEVQDSLQDYLRRPEVQEIPRLHTLIHRCLGQSWQAAIIAQPLRKTDSKAYGEIITGICQDLQHRGLPFEAQRLANLYSLEPAIKNSSNATLINQTGKLLPILSDWVKQQLTLH